MCCCVTCRLHTTLNVEEKVFQSILLLRNSSFSLPQSLGESWILGHGRLRSSGLWSWVVLWMPHPWRHSRPGWMGLWAAWSVVSDPAHGGRVETGWSWRSFSIFLTKPRPQLQNPKTLLQNENYSLFKKKKTNVAFWCISFHSLCFKFCIL